MEINKERVHAVLVSRGVINPLDPGYTDTEVLEIIDTVLMDYLNTKSALKNLVAKAQLYSKFTGNINNTTN